MCSSRSPSARRPSAEVYDIPAVAEVPVPQPPVSKTPPPAAVELRLRGGRSLHFDSTMDPATLTALIRAVEAA